MPEIKSTYPELPAETKPNQGEGRVDVGKARVDIQKNVDKETMELVKDCIAGHVASGDLDNAARACQEAIKIFPKEEKFKHWLELINAIPKK
ncbi:MAG: hypothetical protein V2A63_03265 [Patescibacteria group bacterium]